METDPTKLYDPLNSAWTRIETLQNVLRRIAAEATALAVTVPTEHPGLNRGLKLIASYASEAASGASPAEREGSAERIADVVATADPLHLIPSGTGQGDCVQR